MGQFYFGRVGQNSIGIDSLPHLGDNLEAFLAFKFQRVGGDVARVLDASAITEIRNRLCLIRNGGRETVSLLYPLAIANLVTAAMNMAARDDIPRVDANVIKLLLLKGQ